MIFCVTRIEAEAAWDLETYRQVSVVYWESIR